MTTFRENIVKALSTSDTLSVEKNIHRFESPRFHFFTLCQLGWQAASLSNLCLLPRSKDSRKECQIIPTRVSSSGHRQDNPGKRKRSVDALSSDIDTGD